MESSSSLLNLVKAGKTRLDETTRRRASSLDGARSEPHLRTSRLDLLDSFEREVFHLPMQALARAVPGCHTVMTAFGATCTGEGLVCAFAFLGWCLSVRACIDGIWLVPIVEVLNGLLKWGFGRPRPVHIELPLCPAEQQKRFPRRPIAAERLVPGCVNRRQ